MGSDCWVVRVTECKIRLFWSLHSFMGLFLPCRSLKWTYIPPWLYPFSSLSFSFFLLLEDEPSALCLLITVLFCWTIMDPSIKLYGIKTRLTLNSEVKELFKWLVSLNGSIGIKKSNTWKHGNIDVNTPK